MSLNLCLIVSSLDNILTSMVDGWFVCSVIRATVEVTAGDTVIAVVTMTEGECLATLIPNLNPLSNVKLSFIVQRLRRQQRWWWWRLRPGL